MTKKAKKGLLILGAVAGTGLVIYLLTRKKTSNNSVQVSDYTGDVVDYISKGQTVVPDLNIFAPGAPQVLPVTNPVITMQTFTNDVNDNSLTPPTPTFLNANPLIQPISLNGMRTRYTC